MRFLPRGSLVVSVSTARIVPNATRRLLLFFNEVEISAELSAELRKAQHVVETFHRFRQLSRELLLVNETICQARPVEDTLSLQEKKGGSDPSRKSRGVEQLLRVIFHGRHQTGVWIWKPSKWLCALPCATPEQPC
jgi:hypothetical protein